VPPDSVRCTRGLQLKLVALGNFQRPLRYNSPDCPVCTGHVRCSKEGRPQELASLGFSLQPRRYNSSDMSGVHRTVRCNIRATTTSRQRSPAGAFNARQKRAVVRHAGAGARTLNSTCPVCTGHQGGPRSQNPNGRSNGFLVTWLSHRTCPVCIGLYGAPYDRQLHQRSSLVVGAINTPTTPPFIASKFSGFQPLYKS
jgi:hypothetical protein